MTLWRVDPDSTGSVSQRDLVSVVEQEEFQSVPGETGPQGPQGVQGPVGGQGPQGEVGPRGPQGGPGPTGETGPQGQAGTGITFKGTVEKALDLPPSGNAPGDAYLNEVDDSLWIWDGQQWVDSGSIQGPPGRDGESIIGPTGPQGIQGPVGPQGQQGIQGPVGPQGVSGTTDANYAFSQLQPSAQWPVVHNLGKYPAVSVVDSGGTVVLPDVHYDSLNAVTVSFGSPTSGQVYFN